MRADQLDELSSIGEQGEGHVYCFAVAFGLPKSRLYEALIT